MKVLWDIAPCGSSQSQRFAEYIAPIFGIIGLRVCLTHSEDMLTTNWEETAVEVEVLLEEVPFPVHRGEYLRCKLGRLRVLSP
jgi:hypothetical protein